MVEEFGGSFVAISLIVIGGALSFLLKHILKILRIGVWIGKVDTKISEFDKFMKRVDDSLKPIDGKFTKIFDTLIKKQAIASDSPLQLTNFGNEISDTVGVEELARELAPELFDELASKDEYTIQERCSEYVRNEWQPSSEIETVIRKTAFQEGIDRKVVLDVIAIVLRDRIILKTKGD